RGRKKEKRAGAEKEAGRAETQGRGKKEKAAAGRSSGRAPGQGSDAQGRAQRGGAAREPDRLHRPDGWRRGGQRAQALGARAGSPARPDQRAAAPMLE